MDFLLLVLVTAVLYVRPAELIPSLVTVPFYEMAIIPALVVASPKIAAQFSAESLTRRPITACVLGLFAASKLSHALNGQIEDLFDVGFAKVVLYYLLVVSVLDTPRRVGRFTASIVVLLTFLASLIQGDLYGWFDIPTIEPMYEYMSDVPRVCGTGLLADPNDLGINMALAITLGLGLLTRRGSGFLRALWAGPIYVLFTTLRLTQSRGSLLALLGGLGMLLVQRMGLVRGALVAAVALPIMVTAIGGRQADLTTSGGTGQSRVQSWAEALNLMRGPALLVGIGPMHLTDYLDLVAHNGFVQAYSEIGLIGGTLFLSAFCCAGVTMYRLRGKDVRVSCPEVRGMVPSTGAALTCYAFGLMSLSQTYYLLTYVVLSLAAAVMDLADPRPRPAIMTLNGRLAARLVALGVGGFVFFKIYVMYAVRW